MLHQNIKEIEQQLNRYSHDTNAFNEYEARRNSLWQSTQSQTSSQSSSAHSDNEMMTETNVSSKLRKGKSSEMNEEFPMLNEGKNPVYDTQLQPHRFWSKFETFVEPINPNQIVSLIPHLEADVDSNGPRYGALPFNKDDPIGNDCFDSME